ncbi:MAG: EamA/RhaT family transporter [Ruminococcaceae bacterium]|nr:EamA/RhaT family transporter [Oscillospiraceae bacterium]
MNKSTSSKIQLISSMVIFGTIGIFVRYIPLSSGIIAFVRGVIGALLTLGVVLIRKEKLPADIIKKRLPLLILSGAAMGFNWILLFEAYRYTTVATATLCYYFAPIFVIVASPIVLKERLTVKKILCVLVALCGMVFVSGVAENGIPSIDEILGVILGIGAALLYSTVVLINKKIPDISPNHKTALQLAVAAVVVLPYVLLTEDVSAIELTTIGVLMLITVGVIHTGMAYIMYFGSIHNLKTQTVAIFSYIDPVVAIILSAVVLKEQMTFLSGIGAVLILGSALVSELPEKVKT